MISNPQVTPVQTNPQTSGTAQTQQPQVQQQVQQQTYTPTPAMGPSASAVNIQIFNPQAYGSAAPIATPNAQYYNNVPQTSLYAPQSGTPAPFVPQTPVAAPAPEPSVMPNSVLPEQQTQPTEAPAVQPTEAPLAQAPQVQETVQTTPGVDIAGLNAKLTSQDLNTQTDGIVEIAKLCDQNSDASKQVIDNSVMANLAGIISQDTSALQGPSQQQIDIALKEQNGEQLTPEEQQISQQSSPRETAEKNKVYAMYTLAMMQKQLRDDVDEYNAANPQQPVPPMNPQDMIGFNEIQNAITTTQVPLVKAAGIEALGYVASKPEDKAILDATILNYANDPDPTIQQAVQEVYAKIGAPLAPAVDATTQAQPQDATQAQPQEAEGSKKKHKLFHKKDKAQQA